MDDLLDPDPHRGGRRNYRNCMLHVLAAESKKCLLNFLQTEGEEKQLINLHYKVLRITGGCSTAESTNYRDK